MFQPEIGASGSTGAITRVVDYLRDAIVELEVWRQNARSSEERQALQRISALIGQASAELRMTDGTNGDPAQQSLQLPG